MIEMFLSVDTCHLGSIWHFIRVYLWISIEVHECFQDVQGHMVLWPLTKFFSVYH